jgi:hypothetical protein
MTTAKLGTITTRKEQDLHHSVARFNEVECVCQSWVEML